MGNRMSRLISHKHPYDYNMIIHDGNTSQRFPSSKRVPSSLQEATTRVKLGWRATNSFNVTVGVNQESVLSSHHFNK